jgi:hypothetical protein
MLSRCSIFALATVAALGATALTSTSAAAMGHGGFGGGGMSRVGGMGHVGSIGHVGNIGRVGGGTLHRPVTGIRLPNRPVTGIVVRPPHPGRPVLGIVVRPPHPGHPGWPPIRVGCHWHHHCWGGPGWIGFGGGIAVGAVGTDYVAPVAATVPVRAEGPCTCLTKTYLDDGSVLFKDLCTKEAAIASPDELKAQAAGLAPQAQ